MSPGVNSNELLGAWQGDVCGWHAVWTGKGRLGPVGWGGRLPLVVGKWVLGMYLKEMLWCNMCFSFSRVPRGRENMNLVKNMGKMGWRFKPEQKGDGRGGQIKRWWAGPVLALVMGGMLASEGKPVFQILLSGENLSTSEGLLISTF